MGIRSSNGSGAVAPRTRRHIESEPGDSAPLRLPPAGRRDDAGAGEIRLVWLLRRRAVLGRCRGGGLVLEGQRLGYLELDTADDGSRFGRPGRADIGTSGSKRRSGGAAWPQRCWRRPLDGCGWPDRPALSPSQRRVAGERATVYKAVGSDVLCHTRRDWAGNDPMVTPGRSSARCPARAAFSAVEIEPRYPSLVGLASHPPQRRRTLDERPGATTSRRRGPAGGGTARRSASVPRALRPARPAGRTACPRYCARLRRGRCRTRPDRRGAGR